MLYRDSLLVFTGHMLPSGDEALGTCSSQIIDVRLRVRLLVHPLPTLQIRLVEPLCRWRQAKTPTSRHDGSPWIPRDDKRKALSGTDMAFKALVMDIQGDWAEFPFSCGFLAWTSKHHPCFACNLTLQDIADNKISGWEGRTMDDDTTAARHARSGP